MDFSAIQRICHRCIICQATREHLRHATLVANSSTRKQPLNKWGHHVASLSFLKKSHMTNLTDFILTHMTKTYHKQKLFQSTDTLIEFSPFSRLSLRLLPHAPPQLTTALSVIYYICRTPPLSPQPPQLQNAVHSWAVVWNWTAVLNWGWDGWQGGLDREPEQQETNARSSWFV